MNQSEVYSYARAAGLSDARAKTAAAVAMAESGGNPRAHNSTPPDDSYGLWQINMLGSLGPSRRALYQLSSNEDLFDPATNARVMSAISAQGANFRPWTTYTSGRYKSYLGTSVSLVSILPGGAAIAGAATDVGNAIGDAVAFPAAVIDTAAKAGDALSKTTRWISSQSNWVRIAYVVGGGALALASINLLARPLLGKAASVAKTATKVKV